MPTLPRVEALHDALYTAASGPPPAAGALPPGIPRAELLRTPAAAWIGVQAARQGLAPFHFERRAHHRLPQAWVSALDGSLAEPPGWDAGVLPERKYQSFRHDLPLASHHPHHRAKWAAHELCHGLVGFAWAPDGSHLFDATAGRLAELLPVVLWYFIDEAFLRRCPDHQGDGALFGTPCPACEAAAAMWADDPDARHHLAAGLRYLDRELAAVARSRRLGRPVPHRWATLDLCSDGVAYALAHTHRLHSEAFHRYIDGFCVEGGGWSPDLDALEARVLELVHALAGGPAPSPLAPSLAHGRWRWILGDLGWRLLQLQTDLSEDGATDEAAVVSGLVDDLAAAVPATARPDDDPDASGVLTAVAAALIELEERTGLVDADRVLALGHPAPGLTPGVGPLLDGLASALPATVALLDEAARDVVGRFAAEEDWSRRPLATRFAAWIATQDLPEALVDLVRWEAAVATTRRHAPRPLPGPAAGRRWRRAEGLGAHRFAHDVLTLSERALSGSVELTAEGTLVAHDAPLPVADTAYLLGRDPSGDLLLLDVDADLAALVDALPEEGADPGLDDDTLATLHELGVLVPAAWPEHTGGHGPDGTPGPGPAMEHATPPEAP